MMMPALRIRLEGVRALRHYSSSSHNPRHLLSIADLSAAELTTLVQNAGGYKAAIKADAQTSTFRSSLQGKSIGLIFQKRSTRTRVSTEAAVAAMGGHPMFLGSSDIQLGKSETLRDTSLVLSGMLSALVARVGPHADIEELARWSKIPIINALSDRYHPLQAITDLLTISENRPSRIKDAGSDANLGLQGTKVAWLGDPTNVLVDLAIGAIKLGIHIAIAAPKDYSLSDDVQAMIQGAADSSHTPGKLTTMITPEAAIKDADFLVNDTWTSMGQEEEKNKRSNAFANYRITNDLARRGGAASDWKYLHCLPRYPEEVEDAVFYSPRSKVFEQSWNRLWAAVSVIDAFVVKKGKIQSI